MNNSISVVIPVFNEEEVIPTLKKRLHNFRQVYKGECEFVFVNDGSTDRSGVLLEEWKKDDSTVHIVHLDQNKGHQNALLAGLRSATSDFIVTMDADLQDPPELIQSMIEEMSKGFDVVHTRRARRDGESFFRKSSAWLYYRLMKCLFTPQMLIDVGDFRCMTKKAVHQFLATFPNSRILRLDLQDLSLKQSILHYDRQKRVAGVSKFTFGKLLGLASGFLYSKKNGVNR